MSKGLNRNQLKYIAVLAMLIDHIGWACVPQASLAGQVIHGIGRLTGPIMAYFAAEGYLHTRDVKKYLLRLGIFAILSWPCFSLFETGYLLRPKFGVIYTLFLGVLACAMWESPKIPQPLKRPILVLLVIASLPGDWPVFDVLWPLFLVRGKDDQQKQKQDFILLSGGAALMCSVGWPIWWEGLFNLCIFAAVPLLFGCYNGQPGRRNAFNKWFFYLFYPVHLVVLAVFLKGGLIYVL